MPVVGRCDHLVQMMGRLGGGSLRREVPWEEDSKDVMQGSPFKHGPCHYQSGGPY